MHKSSDDMILEATLRRELQYISFMIDNKITPSHSLDVLIKVSEYINDRIEHLSK